jgi:hypothetical protein
MTIVPLLQNAAAVKKTARAEPVKLPECKVGGIVYNESNPMALLQYKGKSIMIKEGDVVDSMLVKDIGRDSIKVVYRKRIFYLKK